MVKNLLVEDSFDDAIVTFSSLLIVFHWSSGNKVPDQVPHGGNGQCYPMSVSIAGGQQELFLDIVSHNLGHIFYNAILIHLYG